MFACRTCSPLVIGQSVHMFSCLSCNSTADPGEDERATVPPPPRYFQLHQVERAVLDRYYDNDTWFLSSAYCTAYDYRDCPTMLSDVFLAYVMDTPPITVHPATVLSMLALVLLTVCEVGYVSHALVTERRRVKAKVARDMLAVAQMRSPDVIGGLDEHQSTPAPTPSESQVYDDDPSSLFHRTVARSQQQAIMS